MRKTKCVLKKNSNKQNVQTYFVNLNTKKLHVYMYYKYLEIVFYCNAWNVKITSQKLFHQTEIKYTSNGYKILNQMCFKHNKQ